MDGMAEGMVVTHDTEEEVIVVLCEENDKTIKISSINKEFTPKLPKSLLRKSVMVQGFMAFNNGDWDFYATRITVFGKKVSESRVYFKPEFFEK